MNSWQAILFDVDGTLYHQTRLRLSMLGKLMSWSLMRPRSGYRTLAALRAYRVAQEKLRAEGKRHADLAQAQLSQAGGDSGLPEPFVKAVVERWMQQEPLPLLARMRRAGLIDCLEKLKAQRLALGVVSDYPATEKLRALGADQLFDVVVSAQDTEVGQFKPSPRGLLVAAERLGISATQAAYVGDRADVDAVAAQRAGMDCFILGARPSQRDDSSPSRAITNFVELSNTLLGHIAGEQSLCGDTAA